MRAALLATLFTGACAFADGIAGQVLEDHSGAPLASADLRLRRAGVSGLAAELETDREGRFQSPKLPAGEYRIEISKANHVTSALTFRVTDPAHPLVVRLVRCGVIAGQVLDGAGQPIRSAMVFAIPKPADGSPLLPYANLAANFFEHADERGQYRLHNLPPGQYVVVATYGSSSMQLGSTGNAPAAPGVGSGVIYYPSNARPQTFSVSGGEEFRAVNFTIISAALFSVSGKVTAPVPEKPDQFGRFWLALVSPEQPGISVAAASADKEGGFRFEGIAPGSYDLLVSGPSSARGFRGAVLPPLPLFGRAHVEVAGQNVEGAGVAMAPGVSVVFLARAAKGAHDCPATVHIGISSLEDWAAILDRDIELTVGREQTVPNLAPGRYHIRVAKLGDGCYVPAPRTLDLSAAAAAIEIELAPAAAIRGRLDTGGGKPVDFAVVLIPADAVGTSGVQVAFPDAESRFAFAGLAPGRYRIAAQALSEAKARWVPEPDKMIEFAVRGGATAEIDLAAPVVRKP